MTRITVFYPNEIQIYDGICAIIHKNDIPVVIIRGKEYPNGAKVHLELYNLPIKISYNVDDDNS